MKTNESYGKNVMSRIFPAKSWKQLKNQHWPQINIERMAQLFVKNSLYLNSEIKDYSTKRLIKYHQNPSLLADLYWAHVPDSYPYEGHWHECLKDIHPEYSGFFERVDQYICTEVYVNKHYNDLIYNYMYTKYYETVWYRAKEIATARLYYEVKKQLKHRNLIK